MSPAQEDRAREIIVEVIGRPLAQADDTTAFNAPEIEGDSLDIVDLEIRFEEAFELEDDVLALSANMTVGEILARLDEKMGV